MTWTRYYIVSHEAYYWHPADHSKVAEVIVRGDGPDDDYIEFIIEWRNLGGRYVPQVIMFPDSWMAYSEFADFFSCLALAHGVRTNVRPRQITSLLDELGFVDRTQRARPDGWA